MSEWEHVTPFNPDAMDIKRKQNLGRDTVQDTTRNCKFLHVKSVLPYYHWYYLSNIWNTLGRAYVF